MLELGELARLWLWAALPQLLPEELMPTEAVRELLAEPEEAALGALAALADTLLLPETTREPEAEGLLLGLGGAEALLLESREALAAAEAELQAEALLLPEPAAAPAAAAPPEELLPLAEAWALLEAEVEAREAEAAAEAELLCPAEPVAEAPWLAEAQLDTEAVKEALRLRLPEALPEPEDCPLGD